MFICTETAFGEDTLYSILDEVSGNGFKIVPAKGGNILEITLLGQQILDGYQNPEALKEAKWGKSALLFPFPNRLNKGRYDWQGREYAFPINNASTENAIHGFIRNESFTSVQVVVSETKATLSCHFSYLGGYAYYPFPFDFELLCSISQDGIFEFRIKCTNQHIHPIPVGFGWHPYFKLAPTADAHQLQLPACELVEINDRMIPTGERTAFTKFLSPEMVADTTLDNCFALAAGAECVMAISAGETCIEISAEAISCPFFQVFTPPHRESVALEPMTCNVDAFNNADGLVILHPNETFETAIVIRSVK
jgi:aldose 1-epimerase